MSSSITQPTAGATVFTVVLVVLLLGFVAIAWRRGVPRRTLWLWALTGCYLIVVARAVFLPLQPGSVAAAGFQGDDPLGRAWNWGTRATWMLYDQNVPGRFMNVALTVPLGVLGPLVLGWNARRLIVLAVAFLLAIECTQLALSVAVGYVYRSFDVNDLMDNTLGVLIGIGLAAWIRSIRARSPSRAPR